MLKNIPKIVLPELIKTLSEMGHGDEIVIADGNFPAETFGKRVIRADGIGGSIISPEFFEEYLGMRVESVDEVEIIRRMEKGIYDEKEYQKALKWVKEKCKPDFDKNPKEMQKSAVEKEKDWEFTAKMACIIKHLYNGNKNLPQGSEEEAVGHNAIVGGFQGQRHRLRNNAKSA